MMKFNYDKDKQYLVACSGGPDSMALLDMLTKEHFNLYVANVNYKTRKESDIEEKIVQDYCLKHNLPFFVSIYKNSNEKKSFEVKAREFRYDFFKEIYDKYHLDGVFVAHHKDDLIETYLLKKQRNVVNDSLIINEKSIVKDMLLIRPLLNIYKDDLLQYCITNKIPYSIDYTNFMPIHSRNIIRAKLKNEDKDKIYENAIQDEKKLQEKKVEVKKYLKEYPRYDCNYLKNKDDLFLAIFLHSLIDTNYKAKVNKGLVLKLKEFINSSKPNLKENIVENYFLVKEYDSICFTTINSENYSYSISTIKKLKTPYFETCETGLKMQGIYLEENDFPITIRNEKKDDKIKLKEGYKKVSRLFIDKKVPAYLRNSLPIIENKNHEIIFVYGLYRKYGLKNVKNNFYILIK